MINNNDKDPVVTATIIFVDLIGSTDVASIAGDKKYYEYLEKFQTLIADEKSKLIQHILDRLPDIEDKNPEHEEFRKKVFLATSITGDEGFIAMATSPDKEDKQREKEIQFDIIDILRFALRLKYKWIMSCINIDLIKEHRKPYELAIGINTGQVKIAHKKDNGNQPSAEGYPINLAKRIEGQSRNGTYSGIFLGESTFGAYYNTPGENPIRFKKQQDVSPLKGISGNIQLYELACVMTEDDYKEADRKVAILQIPKSWEESDDEDLEKRLNEIKRLFLANQNPWLANLYCNIKWLQAAYKIESDPDASNEKLFQEILDTARDLVEFDTEYSTWKIYFSQIVVDYVKYGDKEPKGELFSKKEVLVDDVIHILKGFTTSEPHELDGRLCYAQLLLAKIDFIIKDESDYEKKECDVRKLKSSAIEQLQQIIVWDNKYPEAYFYSAVAELIDYEILDEEGKERHRCKSFKYLEYLVDMELTKDLKKEWGFHLEREKLDKRLIEPLKNKGKLPKNWNLN